LQHVAVFDSGLFLAALSEPTARDVSNFHDFNSLARTGEFESQSGFARAEPSVRRFGMARRDEMIGMTDRT
jgi:hypothetical protein